MKHELYYRTELGGWVCTCQRYFDNEDELNEHIENRKDIEQKIRDKGLIGIKK